MAITPKIENDVLKDGASGRQYSIEAVGGGMSTITEDMSVLDTVGTRATAELLTNIGIITCTHSKIGTVHDISSENTALYSIRFTAMADYIDGDAFTVNGMSVVAKGLPNFKVGDVVFCLIENSTICFQHSAGPEAGSNANGTYIKYPDGTLICTKTVSHNITGLQAWGNVFVENKGPINLGSWAMPFIARPVASVTASCLGGTFWTAIAYPADANGPGAINAVRATTTDTKTVLIDAIGIGRWK